MTSKLSFWTPVVKYEHPDISFGQRMGIWADRYCHLSGPVAIVVSTTLDKKSSPVRLEKEYPTWWHTALKITSYATVLPLAFMFACKLIVRVVYPFHVCNQVLPIALNPPAPQAQQINSIRNDEWLEKARCNDCHFTNTQFLQLPIELKRQIYQIANVEIHKELLQKLRMLGMHHEPAEPEGPSLISYDMDAIDIDCALHDFLRNLRRKGLLLTQKEFAQKDPARYYDKGKQLGRILGRDYIERTIQRLNLQHIKVPKKIAVIDPAKNGEDAFLEIRLFGLKPSCPRLHIYAEQIERITRTLTQQEMLGLLDVIEATGFNDFLGENLIMGKNHAGEEGLYFIDTEYHTFNRIMPYDAGIEKLYGFMAKQDHPWLEKTLKQRIALCEQ